MDLNELIRPELLTLVPALYLVGAALKRSATLADKWIPLALGALGMLLASAYLIVFSSGLTVGQCLLTGTVQGILCAGASVYANQVVKQAGKEE